MMAGAMIGAARAGAVVLVDGFIASVAALAATGLAPALGDYLVFAHRSAERGHRTVLEAIGTQPLLDFDMRLGEGTGALLAWPVLKCAAAMMSEMASFESRRGERTRPMIRVREELAVFLLAVQLLTRWPIRTQDLCTEARLTASTRYYPLVGALVGAFAGGVFWLAYMVFPVMLAIVLATAASLLATGAFHEDGFADTCDGLGGGTTRERALEIMRDSRLGTYGVAGLGLMLAAKVLAIAAAPPEVIPWLLVAAHAASRSSAVLALATSAYVRGAGIATPVAGSTRPENWRLRSPPGPRRCACCSQRPHRRSSPRGSRGSRPDTWPCAGCTNASSAAIPGTVSGAVQQTSELGMYLGIAAAIRTLT